MKIEELFESTWANRYKHWCKVNGRDPQARTSFRKFVNNHKRIGPNAEAALEKELGIGKASPDAVTEEVVPFPKKKRDSKMTDKGLDKIAKEIKGEPTGKHILDFGEGDYEDHVRYMVRDGRTVKAESNDLESLQKKFGDLPIHKA